MGCREFLNELLWLCLLSQVDWSETPLATFLTEKYQIEVNDVIGLKDLLVSDFCS